MMMPARQSKKLQSLIFNIAVAVSLVATLVALGAFAYLGTFTRYIADDYCEAIRVSRTSPVNAVLERYIAGQWRAADRFSNLLFVGVSESLGPNNVPIAAASMILLWIAALIWSVYGFQKIAGLQWSFMLTCLLAVLLAFFAILQAPNLFQTLYWRSGMATHFAPLVFLFLLAGFVLHYVCGSRGGASLVWVSVPVFLSAFLIGGFSEPPTAMMIVGMALILAGLWLGTHGTVRRLAMFLSVSILAGALLALFIMFFSPANALHSATRTSPSLPAVIERTLQYTFGFMLDTLKVLPLPTFLSALIPGLLFFCLYVKQDNPQLSLAQRRQLWILIVVIPLILFILVASSFAPSAYGQSYPEARARFLGRLLMTAALMLEGGLFGVLAAQLRGWSSWRYGAFAIASLVILLFALYPLRAAWITFTVDASRYRKWTTAWDARNSIILAEKARGAQDLVVRQIPGFEYLKEFDARTHNRINRCAATFYGVHTIKAIRFGP